MLEENRYIIKAQSIRTSLVKNWSWIKQLEKKLPSRAIKDKAELWTVIVVNTKALEALQKLFPNFQDT